jgi:hypothetical protein
MKGSGASHHPAWTIELHYMALPIVQDGLEQEQKRPGWLLAAEPRTRLHWLASAPQHM